MPLPLPVSPAELQRLVDTYGTPLQLYSEAGIRGAVRSLVGAFAKAGVREFKEFYAVKALPNPAVLQIVKREGCGLDCSSAGELWVAHRLGFRGDQVMYTSNYTSKSDLAVAVRNGVIINLDDASLVQSLADMCAEQKLAFPELLCFRLNPGTGNTSSETKSNLLGGPSAKFGVPPDAIEQAYRDAMRHGAKRFGIHMMTGSCVMDTDYWALAVGKLLETAVELQQKLGITFEFVNVGGGIGIPYRPEQAPVDLDAVAKAVVGGFEKAFGSDRAKWPRLCMENGRFITGPYGWLVARCNAVKEAYGTRFYGLDACMANLMRPGMYGSYHHISVVPVGGTGTTATSVANVVGTLCENNDWFASARELPNAKPGDLFVIHDTGAHSHSMGFQYNAKLRAPEVLLPADGSEPVLIRERETIEGLFANTRMPAYLRDKATPARVVSETLPARLAKRPALVVGGLSALFAVGVVVGVVVARGGR